MKGPEQVMESGLVQTPAPLSELLWLVPHSRGLLIGETRGPRTSVRLKEAPRARETDSKRSMTTPSRLGFCQKPVHPMPS